MYPQHCCWVIESIGQLCAYLSILVKAGPPVGFQDGHNNHPPLRCFPVRDWCCIRADPATFRLSLPSSLLSLPTSLGPIRPPFRREHSPARRTQAAMGPTMDPAAGLTPRPLNRWEQASLTEAVAALFGGHLGTCNHGTLGPHP